MGRANRPTRRVKSTAVRQGDVVLIHHARPSGGTSSRWLLVDYVNPVVPGVAWSGRWVFGDDAGRWTIVKVDTHREYYVVKDQRDAARDRDRLATLPRNAHV